MAGRPTRQEFSARRPTPPATFVIDESVLRRPIGGRHVLRGQLEHLLLAGRRRTVDVQIMPLDREGSHSSEEGGECVEVAARLHTVHVRDSKDTVRPGSPSARMPGRCSSGTPSTTWAEVLGAVVNGTCAAGIRTAVRDSVRASAPPPHLPTAYALVGR
ncbi:Scr1 family TA system antitoxin-like transcriptional regulator [Streptomyces sp. NPDC054766]